jgi:hypothetical protein
MNILVFVTILLFYNSGQSCIWVSENKDGSSPYWPSNRIEVCFVKAQSDGIEPPSRNPIDLPYIRKYEMNKRAIKDVVEKEFNERTDFKFFGFNECPKTASTDNLKPMIRLDINGTQGRGATAHSIGPLSSRSGPSNIDLNVLNFITEKQPKQPRGQALRGPPPASRRVFHDEKTIKMIALHEIMHIMGFMHSEQWENNSDIASLLSESPDVAEVVTIGSSKDPLSMLDRAFSEPRLSDRDIQCLNAVAQKNIKELNQARIFTNQSTVPQETSSPTVGH